MKLTNEELKDLAQGLMLLKNVKNSVIGFRVGHAFKQIRPALEALEEQEQKILEEYAELDPSGRPVIIQTETGEGVKLRDAKGFVAAKKPLLAETVEVPELKPVTYSLLQMAEVEVDGEIVALLGQFLTGEPVEPKE